MEVFLGVFLGGFSGGVSDVSMWFHWGCLGCRMDVSWLFLGCIFGVSGAVLRQLTESFS